MRDLDRIDFKRPQQWRSVTNRAEDISSSALICIRLYPILGEATVCKWLGFFSRDAQ